MNRKLFLLLLVTFAFSCKEGKKYHDEIGSAVNTNSKLLNDILEFQKELNASYKNPETSPLPDRYRAKFESLDFFEADTNYIVEANLELTPDSKSFMMPTTTERKSLERVYGIASFVLNGKRFQLEIYQDLDLMEDDGFEDYLFLPFLDETNGNETYGGGRYIDLRIPEGNTLVIDFNRAYNPYCVYNKKYSCPLVPRQNYLTTKVMAGVRDFKKE
ncbi:DUF1684 domain-containing protein [Croceivirga thetidis]|uniref:DUF1684 domain-containing protein n=1 Tax=Croceivirga thetidis TaxID=2721623 RepID=A0ABX1GVS5_9FLAO|nr:DUF1684 domain-containing protein [Croceivirga thetidis]NKI33000.1 DUF1684 domain-containing protein [Croceivirga thetidis]